MFKKKPIVSDPRELLNYVLEEREIAGEIVKVKVYPSSADKIIKELRERREAAPAQKQITGGGE